MLGKLRVGLTSAAVIAGAYLAADACLSGPAFAQADRAVTRPEIFQPPNDHPIDSLDQEKAEIYRQQLRSEEAQERNRLLEPPRLGFGHMLERDREVHGELNRMDQVLTPQSVVPGLPPPAAPVTPVPNR